MHGGRHRLCSLLYPAVWEPRAAFRACCRRPLAALPWGRLPLHESPNVDCVCGVYAVADPERALRYLSPDVAGAARAACRAVGAVALWGRAVEAQWGWRAARAYPVRVVLPEPARRRGGLLHRRAPLEAIARDLAAYGVEVAIASPVSLAERTAVLPPGELLPVSLGSGMRAR